MQSGSFMPWLNGKRFWNFVTHCRKCVLTQSGFKSIHIVVETAININIFFLQAVAVPFVITSYIAGRCHRFVSFLNKRCRPDWASEIRTILLTFLPLKFCPGLPWLPIQRVCLQLSFLSLRNDISQLSILRYTFFFFIRDQFIRDMSLRFAKILRTK